jgi:ethanolamine utilization protein EutP (predicted NTPase)
MVLQNATIFSILATSECTAGSLLTACDVRVAININSAQRNRTQSVSQPATKFSDAVTEKQKVAVITKVALNC